MEKIIKPKPIELINLLKQAKNIYIQGHNYPDPDAIGSAFGLQNFLRHYGIDSTLCYVGAIDRLNTKFMLKNFGIDLYKYDDIKHKMSEEDFIINVDAQKLNANITDIIGEEVACIDHHPVFIPIDEYKYKDIRITGACASIIASYYYETNTPIEKHVASAMAYAIKMDTSELIRGVTALDVDMLNWLYKMSDLTLIKKMYTYSIEYLDLKAYGTAIENIEIYENIGISYVPFDCNQALVAVLSDFILSLDVVEVSIVYSINKDGLKVSVRSEISSVNAGTLIEKALMGIGSGGGHSAMAGGFVSNKNLKIIGSEYKNVIKERFIECLGGRK